MLQLLLPAHTLRVPLTTGSCPFRLGTNRRLFVDSYPARAALAGGGGTRISSTFRSEPRIFVLNGCDRRHSLPPPPPTLVFVSYVNDQYFFFCGCAMHIKLVCVGVPQSGGVSVAFAIYNLQLLCIVIITDRSMGTDRTQTLQAIEGRRSCPIVPTAGFADRLPSFIFIIRRTLAYTVDLCAVNSELLLLDQIFFSSPPSPPASHSFHFQHMLRV